MHDRLPSYLTLCPAVLHRPVQLSSHLFIMRIVKFSIYARIYALSKTFHGCTGWYYIILMWTCFISSDWIQKTNINPDLRFECHKSVVENPWRTGYHNIPNFNIPRRLHLWVLLGSPSCRRSTSIKVYTRMLSCWRSCNTKKTRSAFLQKYNTCWAHLAIAIYIRGVELLKATEHNNKTEVSLPSK